MKHLLESHSEKGYPKEIIVDEHIEEKKVLIALNDEYIIFEKQELREFIGILLHVQAKLRGGKNG